MLSNSKLCFTLSARISDLLLTPMLVLHMKIPNISYRAASKPIIRSLLRGVQSKHVLVTHVALSAHAPFRLCISVWKSYSLPHLAQILADLGVLQLGLLFGHFPAGGLGPDHERVHRSFDVIFLLICRRSGSKQMANK